MIKVKDMSQRARKISPKALTCEAPLPELFFHLCLPTLPPHWPHEVTTAGINHTITHPALKE